MNAPLSPNRYIITIRRCKLRLDDRLTDDWFETLAEHWGIERNFSKKSVWTEWNKIRPRKRGIYPKTNEINRINRLYVRANDIFRPLVVYRRRLYREYFIIACLNLSIYVLCDNNKRQTGTRERRWIIICSPFIRNSISIKKFFSETVRALTLDKVWIARYLFDTLRIYTRVRKHSTVRKTRVLPERFARCPYVVFTGLLKAATVYGKSFVLCFLINR